MLGKSLETESRSVCCLPTRIRRTAVKNNELVWLGGLEVSKDENHGETGRGPSCEEIWPTSQKQRMIEEGVKKAQKPEHWKTLIQDPEQSEEGRELLRTGSLWYEVCQACSEREKAW